MGDRTLIEWTDATWNPIVGCSVTSPGCTNCYAMTLAGTRLKNHPSRAGLTIDTKAGPVWNGEVRLIEKTLTQPLRWKRPRNIFPCAHGDLFHEKVPDEWIDKVFAVMALAPQHTFQVLTKRAGRMRAYFSKRQFRDAQPFDVRMDAINEAMDAIAPAHWCKRELEDYSPDGLPLPNVWLGVSAEDQQRADERIPHLLATPAAKRFISAEPLLGPIELTNIQRRDDGSWESRNWLNGTWQEIDGDHYRDGHSLPSLDWVIVGGESGAKARPMHPHWARSLRDQCQAAGVPFFFKQWGEHHPAASHDHEQTGCTDTPVAVHVSGEREWRPAEAFSMLCQPGWVGMCRLGKKAAGALLDGREHREFPA